MIKFSSSNNAYFEFSNFYLTSFKLDNRYWKSVEHYYQAHKNLDFYDEIWQVKTPKQAALLGRSIPIRGDWEKDKSLNYV